MSDSCCSPGSKASHNHGIPEYSPAEVQNKLKQLKIIDVRRPDELTGELGHIPGAERITLESEFSQRLPQLDRNQDIVFVCRSGGRSARATEMAQAAGFNRVWNMVGGMIAWNENGFKVDR